MVEILVNTCVKAIDCEDIIQKLGRQMFESGYVKNSYISAVLDREKTSPTGLRTGSINVAIPHADPTYVNETTIAVATLKKPVAFHLMEDMDQEVDVGMVFLLAIKEPGEQTKFLKKLMSIFQNPNLLEKMMTIKNENILKEKICSLLN